MHAYLNTRGYIYIYIYILRKELLIEVIIFHFVQKLHENWNLKKFSQTDGNSYMRALYKILGFSKNTQKLRLFDKNASKQENNALIALYTDYYGYILKPTRNKLKSTGKQSSKMIVELFNKGYVILLLK